MVQFKIRFLARIKLARFRANSSNENYLFVALVISMKVREKDEREGKREELLSEFPSRNRILTGNRPTPSKAIVEKEIGGKIGRNATCYLGRATEMATN